MAESAQLAHQSEALPSRLDRQTALQQVASLAAAIEPQPGYWEERFVAALQRAILVPGLDAVLAGQSPAEALADRFGLRPTATTAGETQNTYPDIHMAASRLARLLIADKAVLIDLSSALPCERRHPDHDDGLDFLGLQEGLQEVVVRLDIENRPIGYVMRCDHPDIERFLNINLDAVDEPLLAVKVSEDFMKAVRDDQEIPLRHTSPPSRQVRDTIGDKDQLGLSWVYDRLRAQKLWSRLIRLWHRTGSVYTVLDNCSESASPLGGAERPDCVAPGLYQAVRHESAVLQLDIDISALVSRGKGFDRRELARHIQAAVRLADNLLDQVAWPLDTIRQDAEAHRRVALNLCGIGDAVDRLGLDPTRFATLREVQTLVGEAQRCAYQYSLSLARERGPCPGLRTEQLLSLVPHEHLHPEVHAGINRHATRHHRLITMCPFAVLPTDGDSAAARVYANLLPVLRLADSLGFGRPSAWRSLELRDLEFFLRLSWAYTRAGARRTS